MSTEAETQLVSVERVIQYMKIETEAPAVVLETLPPRSWPEKGAIDFKNVKLRYRCVFARCCVCGGACACAVRGQLISFRADLSLTWY
jgi:hypothetical protein